MDKVKEDKFHSARVQEIDQRRQRRELHSALEPTLPNPHKSQQSIKWKHAGLNSTQRSADNVIMERSGYSNRTNVEVNMGPKKQSTWDLLTQASAADYKVPGHGRKAVKRSGRGMPESVTFEVKMDEFPELTGIFVDQGDHSQIKGHCWGLPSPTVEENSQSPWKVNRTASTANYEPLKTDAIMASCENALGNEGNSASITSSWANIASQPPRKPLSKENSETAPVAEIISQEEEVNTGKKRRKKKKNKAKGTEDEIETEKPKVNQPPPRFEDEDEFPGLTPCFTWAEKSTRTKTNNLCNNTQSVQLQPIDQQKDRPQSAKSPFTETSKAQKAEKVSGKKSKVPVQLDIGNMLAVLEKKQSQKAKLDTKPLTLTVGGGLPVVPKQQPAQKKPWMQDKIAHNPLDSTSPLVKKGKQREVPKAKKPTALKKVILKEREERKQKRLLEEKGLQLESDSMPDEDTAKEESNNAADSTLTEELGSPKVEDPSNEDTEHHENTAEELTTSTLVTAVDRPKIHSRKFREYCNQMLSKDVDECVTTLLKELVRFQDRLYQKDPMKARMKRRIVMGLREVLKHLKLKKVKCVIISPNCERIQSKGGLDEALHAVIDTCREQEVPFVFALSRRALGRCVNKVVPVSLVGIFNFDGAQDIYHKMIELSSEARTAYETMLLSLEQTESENEVDKEQPLKTNQTETVCDPSQSEEPEYIKLWKKLLDKESGQNFFNFEEELRSMCLDQECTEDSDSALS